jgi:hypothetical protein
MRVVPLFPCLSAYEAYFAKLEDFIDRHAESHFLLGVNNPAHIAFARRMAQRSNVELFLDVYTYISNSFTLSFYRAALPRILFHYEWLEKEFLSGSSPNQADKGRWSTGGILLRDAELMPYFISRGCYLKHNVTDGVCAPACRRSHREKIANNKNQLEVIVADCYTFLLR